MAISNPLISQVFSISEPTWTTINKRVGFIFRVDWLNQNSLPFNISYPDEQNLPDLNALDGGPPLVLPMQADNGADMSVTTWNVGTNVANVLPQCNSWRANTYQGLSNLCQQIYNYAGNAITVFQNLQKEIEAAHDVLTPEIKNDIVNIMANLKSSTIDLSQSASQSLTNLKSFILANQQLDNFFQNHNFLFNLVHIPELLPASFNAFDTALEKAEGAFRALSDDLAKMIITPDSITSEFIENMEINIALTHWENIQNEANGFMAFAGDQKQYWDRY